MTELLKQGRYVPMDAYEQAVAILAGNQGFLDDLPVEDVVRFRTEMLDDLRVSAKDLFDTLHQTNKFDDELEGKFHDAIVRFKTSFATTQA